MVTAKAIFNSHNILCTVNFSKSTPPPLHTDRQAGRQAGRQTDMRTNRKDSTILLDWPFRMTLFPYSYELLRALSPDYTLNFFSNVSIRENVQFYGVQIIAKCICQSNMHYAPPDKTLHQVLTITPQAE